MWKTWFKRLLIVGLLIAGLIIAANLWILTSSSKYIYLVGQQNLPSTQVALILGSRVYSDGSLSDILNDRVQTALELYDEGTVAKILVSGDNGQEEYDEVNAVKDVLLDAGVVPEDIFLDHAGFDTYDSLYRAREVFAVDSLVVVTQEYHLPRAVFIGRALDLEVYGVIADRHRYIGNTKFLLREKLARVKAVYNVLIGSKPKFLGEVIDINGDGTESWD